MEKYERNIKIKRILTTIDTDDDGIDDTIAYLNQEDLFLPILLKQSIKDLGVYTDHKEEEETIDLGSFWVTNNDGYDDFGNNPISDGVLNPYGTPEDGTETVLSASTLETEGCMDPNAINYYSGVTIPCAGCCDYGFSGGTSQSGGGSFTPAASVGGGCYELSSGCLSDLSTYTITYMETKAEEWCKATHSSCGGSYVIDNNCTSNGCGNAHTIGCIADNPAYPTVIPNPCICCPGPVNTHHLLTQSECTAEGFACDGTYSNGCNCSGGGQYIFGGIKDETTSSLCSTSGDQVRKWRFYCVPD